MNVKSTATRSVIYYTDTEDKVILKQDKLRGVALIDRHKHTDKCLALLSAN